MAKEAVETILDGTQFVPKASLSKLGAFYLQTTKQYQEIQQYQKTQMTSELSDLCDELWLVRILFSFYYFNKIDPIELDYYYLPLFHGLLITAISHNETYGDAIRLIAQQIKFRYDGAVDDRFIDGIVRGNDREAIIVLIDHGLDVNELNSRGETVIFAAIRHNDIRLTNQLIEKNANLNAINNCGMTPLMTAAINGHAQIASILINNKAELKLTNDLGDNALKLATLHRHHAVATLIQDAMEREGEALASSAAAASSEETATASDAFAPPSSDSTEPDGVALLADIDQ